MIQLFKNEVPVDCSVWTFPGQEIGVRVLQVDPKGYYLIEAELPTSDDIFAIMNIADALYRAAVPKENIHVHFSYLPYSRQDRVCREGESFALDVFLRALSTAPIGMISTIDAHSKVSEELMSEHFDAYMNVPQHVCAADLPEFDVLIAPDKGAALKISQHAQVSDLGVQVVTLNKTREGGLVIYENLAVGTIVGDACVVDDLCDGGATFIAVARMLKATQPELTSLSLYVTHGIFSKGTAELKELYDNIYCNNLLNKDVIDVTLI